MIMQPFPAKTRKRVKFMSYTKIAAIYADSEALSGQTVTVGGWVRTIRDMKTFGFIELNDGSCFKNLQVVMEAGTLENYKDIAAQNVGAALIVTGTVVLTPEAKQPLELKAASIEVEGTSTSDYPLQKKRHSVEFLRTIQHLRPRTNLFSAVFRVRSVAAYAIHQFFQERGFVYVHTPIITASDCEGAGEMFQVTTLDVNDPPRLPDGSRGTAFLWKRLLGAGGSVGPIDVANSPQIHEKALYSAGGQSRPPLRSAVTNSHWASAFRSCLPLGLSGTQRQMRSRRERSSSR